MGSADLGRQSSRLGLTTMMNDAEMSVVGCNPLSIIGKLIPERYPSQN